jgi:predicted Zn-dependent peptidase
VLVRALPEGIAVWLDPMRDVRSVALGVYVAGGSADEDPRALGSTHFLEHLLFKRTRRRSGAAIARMTDRLGGDCDAYTTKEYVAFHARTTAERLDDAVDLLLDLTEAPAFTHEDVEVERGVILEEMAEANDVPEDRLHDTFLKSLWPRHPLGAPILGTRETVEALTRARLEARFREIFVPERTAIVAAGAFEPDRLLARLEKARRARRRPRAAAGHRGGVAGGPPHAPGRPQSVPVAERCAFHLPRPELTQTHVLLGTQTIPWAHPLVPAASLAITVLGGGVSSRLWRDVRERKGLAYHVGTALTLHRQAGIAFIEAATAPANLPRLLRTAGRVVRRMLEDGITTAELVRAKNQVRAEVALGLESTAARRENAARSWLYRGRPYEADEYLAEVEAVSAADLAKGAQLLFGASPLGLGITGPPLARASVEDLVGELAA